MNTLDDLREDSASLPGVESNPHVGYPVFRVRDKLLMSADLGYRSAIMHVGAATATMAAGDDPARSAPASSWADASGADDG